MRRGGGADGLGDERGGIEHGHTAGGRLAMGAQGSERSAAGMEERHRVAGENALRSGEASGRKALSYRRRARPRFGDRFLPAGKESGRPGSSAGLHPRIAGFGESVLVLAAV